MTLPPNLIQTVIQYMCQHIFQKSHLEDSSFFFYSNHLYAAILPLKIGHKSWGNYIKKKYGCSLWAEDVQTLSRIQTVIYLDFSTSSHSLPRECPLWQNKVSSFFILFFSFTVEKALIRQHFIVRSSTIQGSYSYKENLNMI